MWGGSGSVSWRLLNVATWKRALVEPDALYEIGRSKKKNLVIQSGGFFCIVSWTTSTRWYKSVYWERRFACDHLQVGF